MGVGGSGVFVGCGHGESCVRLVYSGMGHGGVGCKIEAMCGLDGFHALHWKMLSWIEFGRCVRVLRVLRRRWVVRDVSGGCKMGLFWVDDIWCIVGGSLCGMIAFC